MCTHCQQPQCRGCPSPAEIAERAAKIREGWSERDHYLRAGRRLPRHLANAHDSTSDLAFVEVCRARGLEAPEG